MAFLDTVAGNIQDAAQVLTGINFKKSFRSPPVNGKTSVGFTEGTFQYVDEKYRVVIENSRWIVNAWLQDNFEFKVSSEWASLLNIPGLEQFVEAGKGMINTVTKAATGATLQNMASTRRKWIGSSPLGVNLRLKFRTYDDAKTEVLDACHALQDMCLPAEMKAGDQIVPGFLIPPGPNEMYATKGISDFLGGILGGLGEKDQAKQIMGRTGDIISIDLFGGNFYLDMVIIKNVSVKFDSKMTEKGPVAAEVLLELESYEVLTKQKLDLAYKGLGYQRAIK